MTRKALSLLLLGGAAGFVNGLLGTGGGIILLFGSLFLGKREETDTRDLLAGTALVTMLLSAVSAVFYFCSGRIALSGLSPYLLPAVFGGATGAFLLDRLPTKALERLFALLTLVGGVLMLFR